MSTELAISKHPTPTFFAPSEEQKRLMKQQICSDLTDAEFCFFMEVAIARQLNPMLGQIHALKRTSSKKLPNGQWVKEDKLTIQTGIDGYIIVADRTGELEGHETTTTGSIKDGTLQAHATVYRRGWRPTKITIDWEEFAQTDREGNPVAMWKKMPKWMLQKVALARALQRTFPESLSGLYTDDEMPPVDVTPKQAARPSHLSLETGGVRQAVSPVFADVPQAPAPADVPTVPADGVNPWDYVFEGIEIEGRFPRFHGHRLCEISEVDLAKCLRPANANKITPADRIAIEMALTHPELRTDALTRRLDSLGAAEAVAAENPLASAPVLA